jgi:predicted nuclease of predicted toxin-antitoxin system
MRILLDQGIPLSLAQILRERGINVEHTSERGLQQASDERIIHVARGEYDLIVTFDADFHSIIARESISDISILRLRISGQKAPEIASILLPIFERNRMSILNGSALSVTTHRVSIRHLPLI